MYFIVHGKDKEGVGPYNQSDPRYRRAFGETLEKVQGITPRKMSPMRRLAIKKMRFQGKLPELVAESAAIRAAMTKEINR